VDAPEEEWEKFYNAAGRPEKPDLYKFSDIDGVQDKEALQQSQKIAADIMHKAGLNQKQADAVWKLYVQTEAENLKQQQGKAAELDKEFEQIAQKHFGDRYADAEAALHGMIKQYVPEELRVGVDGIVDNPKMLAAFMAIANGAAADIAKIKTEYGAEGKMQTGGQSAGASIEDTRRELAALRSSREAQDFTNPKHKETIARIAELSAAVKRHYG
jgi:hypothetical protein